jgi:hypothetical protein
VRIGARRRAKIKPVIRKPVIPAVRSFSPFVETALPLPGRIPKAPFAWKIGVKPAPEAADE